MILAEHGAGVIFVMIGPGGAGKNAIMKALIAGSDEIRQLATATTRPMRADEKQDREHLFLNESQFKTMIQAGQLLEYQEVTPGKFYGIPRQTVTEVLSAGGIRMADIDVLGAGDLAAAFPGNVVQIFVTVAGADRAEQLAVLRRRMQQRADENTDIERRLKRAEALELPYQCHCDYVVVNDDLGRAIARTRSIIADELRARGLWSEKS